MTISYEYNEERALKADEAAQRLEHATPYVGKFTKVSAIVAQTGTHGMEFQFEAPGNGSITFSLYTRKEDGTEIFGANFLNAMMFFLGLKSLRAVPGTVEAWDNDINARVEKEGHVFPELCNKPIGLVFQKELCTNNKGNDAERMNLAVVFQPETRLLLSEIKERKSVATKLDKTLKTLKVKDTRKKDGGVAVGQPTIGGVGDY